MSVTFRLPYVPQPYPDEILGSWLARVYLQNGNGVWRPLMEAAGYGTKLQAPLFDLVTSDRRLDYLLAACGTTYEHVLQTRTTALFWSSLAGSDKVEVPGAPGFPMPINNGKVIQDISRLGLKRAMGETRQGWHCPACLAEDIDQGRQPYWRRSHHLPNVHYCTNHWLPLLSDCRVCGASTLPMSKNALGVLQIHCICGADRRIKDVSRTEIPNFVKEVCVFSTQTLALDSIHWNFQDIRGTLRRKLSQNQALSQASMVSILAATYPLARRSRYGVSIPTPSTDRQLTLNPGTGRAPAAPVMAALLVAAGLSLEATLSGIGDGANKSSSKVISKEFDILQARDKIEVARSLFLKKLSTHRRSPIYLGRVFLFLRFYDLAWLVSVAGDRFRVDTPIPTIEQDRLTLQHLGDSFKPTTRRGTESAAMRASVRDREWWDSFKEARKQNRFFRRRNNLDDLAISRRASISEAIAKLVDSRERPVRISYGLLGKHTGLTSVQVMLLVTKDAELFSSITDANASKKQRQLIWALRMLVNEKAEITTGKVFRKAGLPHTSETTPFVRKLVSEFHSGHRCN